MTDTAGKTQKLFDKFDLGGLPLPNRMVMAPMTRTRASADGVPNDLMRDYTDYPTLQETA